MCFKPVNQQIGRKLKRKKLSCIADFKGILSQVTAVHCATHSHCPLATRDTHTSALLAYIVHGTVHCAVDRDKMNNISLTDWIMLDLGSILHANSKTVFVFALGPLKTKELSFWPLCHF